MTERSANTLLAALIAASRLSHAGLARAFFRVALEMDAPELAGVGRSHVSHWVAGTRPSGLAPTVLAEALGRTITAVDLGLDHTRLPATNEHAGSDVDWGVDTLTALADLRRDDVDLQCRQVLNAAPYSVAALALPQDTWWQQMSDRSRPSSSSLSMTAGDQE